MKILTPTSQVDAPSGNYNRRKGQQLMLDSAKKSAITVSGREWVVWMFKWQRSSAIINVLKFEVKLMFRIVNECMK